MGKRKTTIMVDDRVLAEAKAKAAHDGRSLSGVVEELLASYGGKAKPDDRPARWELPVLGRGGKLAPIDWTSNVAVWEYLEGDLPLDKQR